MKRYIDINEISDGKFYELNDMVKADCGDCTGCFSCCQGMGESIILDPFDVFRLEKGLQKTFEELLSSGVELHVVDGIVLPNLSMSGKKEQCRFLNEEGRCSIHAFRPGICRLFPLGRYYEGESFKYFLQVNECRKTNRSKIKVWKWIDTPETKKYDQYIADWHIFLKKQQSRIEALLVEQTQMQTESETVDVLADGAGESRADVEIRQISMNVLRRFYLQPYESSDFYSEFYERLHHLYIKGDSGADPSSI